MDLEETNRMLKGIRTASGLTRENKSDNIRIVQADLRKAVKQQTKKSNSDLFQELLNEVQNVKVIKTQNILKEKIRKMKKEKKFPQKQTLVNKHYCSGTIPPHSQNLNKKIIFKK